MSYTGFYKEHSWKFWEFPGESRKIRESELPRQTPMPLIRRRKRDNQGTICWGHAPPSSLRSLVRVLKPAGVMIVSHHIDDYEREGWGLPEAYRELKEVTLIRKERGPYYNVQDPANDRTGLYLIYSKQPVSSGVVDPLVRGAL